MAHSSIPFNIRLPKYPDKRLDSPMVPLVTSQDDFEGSSKNLNQEGLFSTTLFGRVGDPTRKYRYGKIDLGLTILHPEIYKAFVGIRQFYGDILSGKTYAIFDKETKDFIKATALDGQTGYTFFIKHCKDIVHEHNDSTTRQEKLKLLEDNKDCYFIDKVIVMPAGLRDIEIDENGRASEDEVNNFYKKLLSVRKSISDAAIRNNPEMVDTARMVLQRTTNELFALIMGMLEGKKKFIMGRWASRRIYNGTRNVITSLNVVTDDMNSDRTIGPNDTAVGLFQYMKATLPLTKYKIRSGFISKVFVTKNAPARLVNKKTFKVESVEVKSDHFDLWMSDEGLDRVVNLFSDETRRHKPLEIDGYYVGLIYLPKDKMVVKVFQDIEELPEWADRKDVHPLTFTELLYMSIYPGSREIYAFNTRYPITGMGSIYPSQVYLVPTIHSEERRELGDNWEVDTELKPLSTFPIRDSAFVNALSPHSSKLAAMGAD